MSIDRIREVQERVRQATAAMEHRLDQQQQVLKDALGAQSVEKERGLGKQEADISAGAQRDKEYFLKVRLPINSLSRRLGMWGKMVSPIRTEIAKEVSELVQRARSGDGISQQILDGVQTRLAEGKISDPSLPSLEWQPKNQPPKP